MAFNYPANTYSFRQDSNFSYFFGLDHPDLAGVIDLDNGHSDIIFGNDVDMDDIIWMGKQPTMKEQAALAGVENSAPLTDLAGFIKEAHRERAERSILSRLTAARPSSSFPTCWAFLIADMKANASEADQGGCQALRMVKDAGEIAEIEKMVDVAYDDAHHRHENGKARRRRKGDRRSDGRDCPCQMPARYLSPSS